MEKQIFNLTIQTTRQNIMSYSYKTSNLWYYALTLSDKANTQHKSKGTEAIFVWNLCVYSEMRIN